MSMSSDGATLIAYAIAAIVTCALTPLARWFAKRSGAIDQPNDRKMHKKPLPTSGGVAILGGCLAAAWLAGASHHVQMHLSAITMGAVLVALIGFVDDRIDLPAKLKLVLQIIATAPLLIAGATISLVSNPFSHGIVFLPVWLAGAVTVVWVVSVTNAINLIDGLDGLAAGVSAISCVALAFIAMNWGQPGAALLCAAIAGAAVGFLPWNWHPAGILMGDTGAYFLGYMIAAATVIGAFKMAAAIAIFVPILVLAVPLLDTVLSPVRRVLTGKHPFQADRDHLHHRLISLGLAETRVVGLTYAVTAICGAVAIWISRH
jgi:UDP-GlcNAc:undecaprenyl-phosphate GlcNAc-1-phosphate transferase